MSPVNPTERDIKRKMSQGMDMLAAFIRRVGQDVKAQGYKVIFTDVGPESLERDAPELFRELAKKASGSGVQVLGFRSAATDATGTFRVKETREKGVGLWMMDFKEDGVGRYTATGTWRESNDKWHDVKYQVIQEGTKWRAE